MAGVGRVVHVASVCEGLANIVRQSLPGIAVRDIALNDKGELTADGKKEIAEKAEILLGDLSCISDVLKEGNCLKWAHSTWAGVDYIMSRVDRNKPPNVILTRTGEAFKSVMAEYVLGYIIATERGILDMSLDQTTKTWSPKQYKDFRTLSQLRLGILGAGNIGHGIGELCKSVGMEVWGLGRSQKPSEKNASSFVFDQYRPLEQPRDFLEHCDYVCGVLPSTPETDHLLSADTLEVCQKKKPVFINIGRGNIIDECSIIKALDKGWIRKAILDVFNEEPLPSSSELWSHPGVVITPHISGPSRSQEVVKPFLSNFRKYVQGEPLDFMVNWSLGY